MHLQMGSRGMVWAVLAACAAARVAGTPVSAAEPPVAARDAARDAASADSGALEEIVVSAEKRTGSLQTTPISLTAITGEALQQQGITDLTEIMQQTPGVSFRSYGPGQTEVEMRGMTSAGGQSPTVGFYLDETPLTPPAAAQNGKVVIDPNLFDLQRVEVLRGPQGTLYGAGSMGGTIRLITNPPNLRTFSVNAQGRVSGTESGGMNHAENAALNIPLLQDKLAVRLVGSYSYDDGWLDRVVVSPFPLESNPQCAGFVGCTRGDVTTGTVVARHRNVNNTSRYGARVSILYQPVDALTINPMILRQRADTHGYSLYDSVPGTDAHYQPFDVGEPTHDTFTLYSLVVKYRFTSFDLTSSTAKWVRRENLLQDAAEVVQDIFGLPEFEAFQGGGGPSTINEIDRSDQFSQELRLSSSWPGPFQALAGAYLSQYHSKTEIYWYAPGFASLFGSSVLTNYFQPAYIRQHALFGEASYKLTPALKLTAGLRWYSYDSTLVTTQSGVANGGPIPATNYASASASGNNPKVSLSYQPDDQLLVYATAAKGFRPGAGNFAIPATSGTLSCTDALAALGLNSAPTQYRPDTVWSYELGNKIQFLDRRVALNSAVYYEKWQGVQQLVPLSCGFVFTDNAGAAQVYGGEAELSARVTPRWLVSLSGGYTRAALTEDVRETGGVKGRQLENVPKVTASAAIAYSQPLFDNYVFEARLSSDYVADRRDPLGYLPSYNLMKIRLGLSQDRWETHLYVNNLTNRRAYLSNATSLSVNLPSYNRVAGETPRTIGIDLNWRFSGEP